MTEPAGFTSRATTAWMGAARTFLFSAVVMSAVAFRPGRRAAGGARSVTVTLKSLAWLPVLAAAAVAAPWPRPREMAEDPISVTVPLISTPSSASTLTSAGWPSVTLRMSVSSTMTSTSMIERSATVMITVGEKLWAPITTSPSSFWRFVTTPSMGETIVVFSRSSRSVATAAAC